MEKIHISNSKGNRLAAVIHRSTGSGKLAILCPGYLDYKDYLHLTDLATKLNELGYTVVRFDPTGTWDSEGDISEYLTSQYLKDVKSVLEHMLDEGQYTHVLLGGHSRGGQISVLYAARDARISEVLAIMPSHGPVTGERRKTWEEAGVAISSRDVPGSTDRREFRVPFQHVLDRDRFDALGDTSKIKAPIFFLAGELDDVVPPEEVKELFDAANEHKKFLLLEGIGHDYRQNPAEVERVNQQILQLLEHD